MKFKPLSNKYDFKKGVLVKNFPSYLQSSIKNWLWKVLDSAAVVYNSDHYLNNSGVGFLKSDFTNELQIHFREVFPQDWSSATGFIFGDADRTANFLAFCLQNFAQSKHAAELEYVLSQGGSGFEVIKTDKKASEYDRGVYDLVERVSPVVKDQSQAALNDSELLTEAWNFCFSRNPDYEKVVSRSCDFLEGFLGKIYFPSDPKPQLKKFVYSLKTTPSILSYKGSSIVNPKNTIMDLLAQASDIRGQHTKGKGRKPTREEAEFVLQTTIYIWNLHQMQ